MKSTFFLFDFRFWCAIWVGVLVVVFLIGAVENIDTLRRGWDAAKVETLSCVENGSVGRLAVTDITYRDGLWTAAIVGPDGKRTGSIMRTNAVCVTARP